MAKKISELTDTSTVTLQTALLEVVEGGNSRRVTAGTLAASMGIVNVKKHGASAGEDIAPVFTSIFADYPNGCAIYVPSVSLSNPYLLNSQISTTDGTPYLILGDGYGSQIKKNFDGDMISLGKLSEIDGIHLAGNGANFTGSGVVISTGATDAANGHDTASWRRIFNSFILGTASYGIDFSAASAGYASIVDNTRILPYNDLTVPSVKFAAGAGNSNVTLSKVWTSSNPIADFGGAVNVQVIDCQGAFPTYASGSTKICVTGSRLVGTASGTGTYNGIANVISGCTVNVTTLVFDAGLVSSKFRGNAVGSGTVITDNSPGVSQDNEIDISQTIYVPTWEGSGSNPDIGDGAIGGAYRRNGDFCHVNIFVTMGGTTTYGTGQWTLTVPYTSARTVTGSVYMEDATGPAVYIGTAYLIGATNEILITSANSTSSYVKSDTPITWATGDKLIIDIDFPIT